MKTTMNRNLVIGFGFSLLLLLASSVASYLSINRLLDFSQRVNHTRQVIETLNGVMAPVRDAESAERGFLLTGSPEFLDAYRTYAPDALNNLDRVLRQTVDNPDQQSTAALLKAVIVRRFDHLDQGVASRRENRTLPAAFLLEGKKEMDSIAGLVRQMKEQEQGLLSRRTSQMDSFAAYTPALIVSAGLIAIIIAIVFYSRVRRDIAEKTSLQEALEARESEIRRRIDIIQTLAGKISSGEFSVRVNDDQKDALGAIAGALNRMAISLEQNFTTISEREWLQSGIAALSERIMGELSTEEVARRAIEACSRYAGAAAGAFYLAHDDDTLQFLAGYAFSQDKSFAGFRKGEGVPGEVAAARKEILLTDISDADLHVQFAAGVAKPSAIYAYPVLHDRHLVGVIELASLTGFSAAALDYLRQTTPGIAAALSAAQNRARLQELLEEMQAQTEELQAQHKELENMNGEMEVQTEKLQASEEELKVQQEELMQTNAELEERGKLLEEKNQQVLDRNVEIQRKAEELEVVTRYKSEFLANMSHELRTPLNSILLLSRLLAENNDRNLTKDQIEYAQVIRSSGNGLLQLIDEILDLSKIESGKMQLEYSAVRLGDVVDGLRSLFDPLSRDRKVDFRILVDPSAPQQVETDKMRMEQVLKNLLSNAFKFTNTGSVTLDLRPDATGEFLEFRVIDTGIGIPADQQQLIFDAFRQADGSTRRKFGGTGLGLSISRELARLLAGELTVISEPGQGSEFLFRMPVRQRVLPAEETPPEATAAAASFAAPAKLPVTHDIPADIPDDRESIAAGDRVILIVEDDTPFAKALLDYTRKQGYKGIVAVRGDVGVELAGKYKPAGILLDLQLPVKNGWEVMDELKANPATRAIPVHVMSSMEARRESISKGAADFITKPIAFEQMNDIFKKIEFVLSREASKVLIVEENPKHAEALGYFLGTYDLQSAVAHGIPDSIAALERPEVNCVILDMGSMGDSMYEKLEAIRKTPGFEQLPVIVFTGKNISRSEEQRIRRFADSIVIKTAHAYQRILDEISLFLHVVEQKDEAVPGKAFRRLGALDEVLRDKLVLIADDDVRNVYSLTKMLEKHRMKVLPAIDGREAVAMVEKNPGVNLVLMDMMMPEMDGYEAIRTIRKIPGAARLPIIAVTAKAMAGDREKCIAAGASDYISKPVDVDQLVSLLRIWLYEK